MRTIYRSVNLNEMCRVENLSGVAFTGESGGHRFVITGYAGENPVFFEGTIAGQFRCPDGTSVAFTSSYASIDSEGRAVVTLPGNCYTHGTGPFGILITNVVNEKPSAIYAAAGFMQTGESASPVDPENTVNVDAILGIIDDMYSAIAECAEASEFVPNIIAPEYNYLSTYAVGDYVTYENEMYRCTTAITTAGGSWGTNKSKFTKVLVGTEVGSVKSVMPYYSTLSQSYANTIADNTDYDTLTTPGNYKCTSQTHARTMTNGPAEAAHRLFVYTSTSGNIVQIAIVNVATGMIFRYRSKPSNASSWIGWNQFANLNDITTSLSPVTTRLTAVEDELAKDDIPDYYFTNNYLPNRLATIYGIRETAGKKTTPCTKMIESIFMTDPHFWDTTTANPKNGLQSVKLMKYVMDHANIGMLVCGGDMVSGQMTVAQCTTLFGAVREHMAPIWDHTYMCVGNHEWNRPGSSYPAENELVFPQVFNQFVADKARDIDSYETTYGSYYTDDKLNGIRYFFLGCSNGGSMAYRQFRWFFDSVCATPSGYTIIVYSHVGMVVQEGAPVWIDSFEPFVNLLDAAKNGQAFSYNWPSTSWTGTHDFANDNLDVACVLSGHIHRDMDKTTTGGITVISTTCDRGPYGDSSHAAFDAARELGTINEQAFDVVQIDMINRTIDLTRIGGNWGLNGSVESPDRHYTY